MAKDPAVLFYTADFISGTITMTDEQRGQYILLLCIQHQKGHLTEKDMLKICSGHDEEVFSKFTLEDGKYYNKRMKVEADKRAAYAESRRQNRKKKETPTEDMIDISKTYDTHMENENENINKGKKEGVKSARKKFTPPTLIQVQDYFVENGYPKDLGTRAFKHYDVADWHDTNGKAVKNWKQKMNSVWFKPENKETKKPKLYINDEEDIYIPTAKAI